MQAVKYVHCSAALYKQQFFCTEVDNSFSIWGGERGKKERRKTGRLQLWLQAISQLVF